MTKPLIEISGLYKVFGRKPESVMERVKAGDSKEEVLADTGHTVGLKDINLKINKGEIFVIMGLSGSGKSTLIRHFNRLIDPTEGQILVEGTDVMQLNQKQLEEFRRHKMSMVFQRFGLLPHRTVVENVSYGLEVQGVEKTQRRTKAEQWLETVGLKGYENQYPAQLSGGQQQRVGLARALCTDAEILLMDEAFSALDPLIRVDMQDLLLDLQAEQRRTVVFITHDLDEAIRIGDRIALMQGGRLLQCDTAQTLLHQPASEEVRRFFRDVDVASVLTVDRVAMPTNRELVLQDGDPRPERSQDTRYVMDSQRRFLGMVTAQRGWLDASETTVLQSGTRVKDAIQSVALCSDPVPVLDSGQRLIGVISAHQLLRSMEGFGS